MIRTLQIILVLLCSYTMMHGQEKGNLCVNFNIKQTTIKVDDQIIDLSDTPLPHCIQLTPGTYIIDSWSEKFVPNKDTVVIEANKTNRYIHRFNQLTDHYQTFRIANRKYQYKKITRVGVTGLILALNGGLTAYYFISDNKKDIEGYRANAEVQRQLHSEAYKPEDVAEFSNSFEGWRQRYNDERADYNRGRIIRGSITLASYLGTYLVLRRMKKKKLVRPVYEPEKNPFVISTILMDYDPSNQRQQIGLTFTF